MTSKRGCAHCGVLEARLERVAQIIEAVDSRAMAADGPVSSTLQEMTQEEMSAIYAIATAHTDNAEPEDEGLVECKLCGQRHRRDFCPTLSIELHVVGPKGEVTE